MSITSILRARRTGLVVVALLALLFVGAEVSAQWSLWSPGTPCSSTGMIPRLDGVGTMSGGSVNTLILDGAPPFDDCFLIVGFSSLRVPFAGGIMGPSIDLIVPITTDAAGMWVATFIWPSSIPPGSMLWYQVWCPDPVPPAWCSSNTLKSTSS